MNIPFFTDYLMLSNSLSIGIIAVFVLALIGIYVLQRKGISFGNLVIIGTIVGAVLGIIIQIIAGFPDDPSKVVYILITTTKVVKRLSKILRLPIYMNQALHSNLSLHLQLLQQANGS